MKKILLFSLLFVSAMTFAQSITKQVIGTAGKTQSNSDIKLSWTTGEPVVGLMTAGGNQLGNGYYPAMDLKALRIQDHSLDLQIKVYPNPTAQMLYVSHPVLNSFSIQIADLNGKQIYAGTITKDQSLDVSNYSPGIYMVTVGTAESSKSNTYKIIKK